jgi:hypothetical protein
MASTQRGGLPVFLNVHIVHVQRQVRQFLKNEDFSAYCQDIKVGSKTADMMDDSLKLWVALTTPSVFARYQICFLSIFK